MASRRFLECVCVCAAGLEREGTGSPIGGERGGWAGKRGNRAWGRWKLWGYVYGGELVNSWNICERCAGLTVLVGDGVRRSCSWRKEFLLKMLFELYESGGMKALLQGPLRSSQGGGGTVPARCSCGTIVSQEKMKTSFISRKRGCRNASKVDSGGGPATPSSPAAVGPFPFPPASRLIEP